MKRITIVLLCFALAGLFVPEMAFCGGKKDNADTTTSKSSGGGNSATSLTGSKVVAEVQIDPKVTKDSILQGQLKTEVERLEKSAGRALTAEERRQVLDVLINERLAVQAATRDKIDVSDNEVNQRILQLRNDMAGAIGRLPTDDEYAQVVKSETGLDVQAFKDQVRRQLTVQKYLLAKKEPLFKSIRIPTEEEIRTEFNLNKARFVRPETVRFSMIQIPYGADAAAKTKAKETADRLTREIGSNASKFDEAAARGQAPNAGYQAGDAGFLPKTEEAKKVVGAVFLDTAFKLRQGEISNLIEGTRAYQIIKITENYPQKNLELDDVYQLGVRMPDGAAMTVRDYIGNVLLQERQTETLAKASQELVQELRTGKTFQVNESNIAW